MKTDEPREKASGGKEALGSSSCLSERCAAGGTRPPPAARAADPSLGADRGGGSLSPLSPHCDTQPGL